MIKKEYKKPTMNVEEIQQTEMICTSQVSATGLDEDLNYNKGTGDMGDAMSRGRNGWGDEAEEEW